MPGGQASNGCIEKYCELLLKRDMAGVLKSEGSKGVDEFREYVVADPKLCADAVGMSSEELEDPALASQR